MKTIFYLFSALFFIISNDVFAIVVEVGDLTAIETEIEQLDGDALVVFDVDNTLIVPKDRILGPSGENYLYELMSQLPIFQVKGDEIASKVLLQSKVSLIDEKVLHLIERLKLKGIKTMALTAISTGKMGLISNMEEWRVDQLNSLGIHFGWAFPSLDSLTLSRFQGKRSQPKYKQGVLASSKYPKGQVLSEFLKQIQWRPSKILFIDDRMDFIESVEFELEREKIPHISFFYTAAIDQPHLLDKEIADFQINYLMERGEWLSDLEAKDFLTEQSQLQR